MSKLQEVLEKDRIKYAEIAKYHNKDVCESDRNLVSKIVELGDIKAAYAIVRPEVEGPMQHFRIKLENNPYFRAYYYDKVSLSGIAPTRLNKKLSDLIDCKKPIVKDGVITDTCDDSAIQLEAVKTGYKLHKMLGNDNSVHIDNRKVEFNIDESSFEQLSKISKELQDLNSKLDLNKHKVVSRKEENIVDITS